MSGYIGSTPVPQATQHRESFTCTEGQTTFNTAGYTAQFVDVYLNGSHLSPADFTATNGSDVVLGVAASADDVCDIISYTPFEVAAQTFTGTTTTDVSLTTGVLTANGGAVFNEGSADVDFRVETNGNANMLFVDGGNNRLQIGSATTDDDQMFQLILAGGSAGFGIHSNRAAAGGSSLIMSHNRNNAVGSFTILNDADTLGRITFQGCDGGDIKTEGAQIAAEVDGTPGTNDMPTRLVFSTTADGANAITERLRIDSAGNVLVGKSSGATDYFLQIAGSGSKGSLRLENDYASGTVCLVNNQGNAAYNAFVFENNGSAKGSIVVSTSATAYNESSDHRLKENVNYTWDATTRLKQLKPARFNFIVDADTTVDGFLAHEVSSIVPEAVYGEHNGVDDAGDPIIQQFDKSKLVPLIVKAMQEQNALIEALTARITTLEG